MLQHKIIDATTVSKIQLFVGVVVAWGFTIRIEDKLLWYNGFNSVKLV